MLQYVVQKTTMRSTQTTMRNTQNYNVKYTKLQCEVHKTTMRSTQNYNA